MSKDRKIQNYIGYTDYLYLAVTPDLLERALVKVQNMAAYGVMDITTGRIWKTSRRRVLSSSRRVDVKSVMLEYYDAGWIKEGKSVLGQNLISAGGFLEDGCDEGLLYRNLFYFLLRHQPVRERPNPPAHCGRPRSCKSQGKDGRNELQILISFSRPDLALSRYKERWQIESCFRGMKSSGFNIEDTHLVHLERVEQLFGVMIISFTWAYLVGIKKDIEVKAIRILKTGNRAISVMKYGLEHIASVLLNPLRPQPFDIFKILSCA